METAPMDPENHISKEIIEEISRLKFLTRADRINIVLVYHGIKPASIIELLEYISSENWQEEDWRK